jgi:hypothetical protein
MADSADKPGVTGHARPAHGRTAAPRASRARPDRGSGSAAWDDTGGNRSGSGSVAQGRRAARPIWPQPIGTQNEVEIEMELDVREFLIGGL